MPSKNIPRISVVIIAFNHGKYISECIESIVNQTLSPFEIIIVDDCSTDNTREIAKMWQNKCPNKINLIKNSVNIGPGLTAIKEMKSIKGELISWLDGDDYWLPNKLQAEWNALKKNTKAKIAYSNVFIVNSKSETQFVWYEERDHCLPSGDVLVQVLSRQFFPNNHSIFRNFLIYNSSLREVGYRDSSLRSYWDWDWKIRLTSRFRVCYSGEASVAYRKHTDGMSMKNPELHLKAMHEIYNKHKTLIDSRSLSEQIKIRLNIEFLIHKQKKSLGLLDHDRYYTGYNIFKRNYKLLCKLKYHDYLSVRKDDFMIFLSLIIPGFFLNVIRNTYKFVDKIKRRLINTYV